MEAFICWSGTRGRCIGKILVDWLPKVIEGLQPFHSDQIQIGALWPAALSERLRICQAGILCITPESQTSPWVLFEAGALSQHLGGEAVFPLLVELDRLEGPLGHTQATRFGYDGMLALMEALASVLKYPDQSTIKTRFDRNWESLEQDVLGIEPAPIEDIIPNFGKMFGHETFIEPFEARTNREWLKRHDVVIGTLRELDRAEREQSFGESPFRAKLYPRLLRALAAYADAIRDQLLKTADFNGLSEDDRSRCEEARENARDLARMLAHRPRRPFLDESHEFEAEMEASERKRMILMIENRMEDGSLPLSDSVADGYRNSVDWGLDRIASYIACRDGKLGTLSTKKLIDSVSREEVQARTRNLTRRLQPLYYSLEALDETLPDREQLGELIGPIRETLSRVEKFLDYNKRRDAGGNIRSRLDSLRDKVTSE